MTTKPNGLNKEICTPFRVLFDSQKYAFVNGNFEQIIDVPQQLIVVLIMLKLQMAETDCDIAYRQNRSWLFIQS